MNKLERSGFLRQQLVEKSKEVNALKVKLQMAQYDLSLIEKELINLTPTVEVPVLEIDDLVEAVPSTV